MDVLILLVARRCSVSETVVLVLGWYGRASQRRIDFVRALANRLGVPMGSASLLLAKSLDLDELPLSLHSNTPERLARELDAAGCEVRLVPIGAHDDLAMLIAKVRSDLRLAVTDGNSTALTLDRVRRVLPHCRLPPE